MPTSTIGPKPNAILRQKEREVEEGLEVSVSTVIKQVMTPTEQMKESAPYCRTVVALRIAWRYSRLEENDAPVPLRIASRL